MTSRTEYCTQTPNKPSLFDVQYLRNHRTLDIGVLGYIGIVWPKEHSPEVRSVPPGTPRVTNFVKVWKFGLNKKYSVMLLSFHRSKPTVQFQYNGCRNKMVNTLALYIEDQCSNFSPLSGKTYAIFMVFLSLPMLGYLQLGHNWFLPHLYEPSRQKTD